MGHRIDGLRPVTDDILPIEGENRIGLDRKAIREAKKYDDKWVIQTNDDTITIEDTAAGYKGLLVVERCFRTLKRTRIKMEPMYHWLPIRIEAHVKLCVFTLLIERVAELQCKHPWSRISRTLSTLHVSEFQTPVTNCLSATMSLQSG
jgi:transposase